MRSGGHDSLCVVRERERERERKRNGATERERERERERVKIMSTLRIMTISSEISRT